MGGPPETLAPGGRLDECTGMESLPAYTGGLDSGWLGSRYSETPVQGAEMRNALMPEIARTEKSFEIVLTRNSLRGMTPPRLLPVLGRTA